MIGNDGICDIDGAKKAGLSTLYVRSEISPKEDFPDADHVLTEMDMEKITEILLEKSGSKSFEIQEEKDEDQFALSDMSCTDTGEPDQGIQR